MNPSEQYIKWVKGEDKGYDWLDATNYLLVANAEISDYNLSQGEINKLVEISERMFKSWCGEGVQYTNQDVEKKLKKAINWYDNTTEGIPEEKFDQAINGQVQKNAKWLKSQEWFNSEFAESVINWLIELADVDGMNDNFKGSINSLANFWGVDKTV